MSKPARVKKPDWLKVRFPVGDNYLKIKNHRDQLHLNTVCQEANCPNMGECWNSGTASFMVMGDTCTRACRFCSVKTAKHPPMLDPNEPANLAATMKDLNLRYVVLTTVDRDDLPDQGAGHIRNCILAIKEQLPNLIIEALIPDFRGEEPLIDIVASSGAKVISHNVECVRRLTKSVRDPRAGYDQSLKVLRYMHDNHPDIYTKSSLMVGLGESKEEVMEAMEDIRKTGATFLTIGQYLQPNIKKLAVVEYIHPDQFEWYKEEGLKMGFEYVASGPLVRSSYRAAEHYMQTKLSKES